MRTATAFFPDGLDLIAQFLACARPADGGIAVSFGSLAELRVAAAALEHWGSGALGEGAIVPSEPAMRIAVSDALWNTLYARAFSIGRPVTPDRTGLSSRGAGGMLAELNIVLEQWTLLGHSMDAHPALAKGSGSLGWTRQPDRPRVLAPWEPLKALLLHDKVLAPEAIVLQGNAIIHRAASMRQWVVLGADVEIGPGVTLPPDMVLDKGARLTCLSVADNVTLPDGTRLGGDLVLRRGVQVGRDVAFGPCVDIGPHVVLPDGASVAAGARIHELRIAADVELPRGTYIAGNLVLCAGVTVKGSVCFGADVRVEAHCRIGHGVTIPSGMVVEQGADVSFLKIAADVTLPCGIRINGNLRIGPGVRVGSGACFGSNVKIGPGVQLPDGVTVMDNARIDRLAIADDAMTGEALMLCGNATIEAGARLENDVLLGADVIVGAGVHLPAGAVLADHARVRALRLGSGLQLPSHFVLNGDLCLGDCVVVGDGVCFGAGVAVGASAVIGCGAVIKNGAVIGSGAVIGEEAVLEHGAVVEAGAQVPAHAHIAAIAPPAQLPGMDSDTEMVDKPAAAPDLDLSVSLAMTPQPCIPPGDAPFPTWHAYLSAQTPAPPTDVQRHDDRQAGTPAQSPPIAIPTTCHQPPSRASYALPWRPPG